MNLEERVKKLEEMVNTVEFAEKIKHIVFTKRSSAVPTDYESAPLSNALAVPDYFQEIILDGQRKLIPLYNG